MPQDKPASRYNQIIERIFLAKFKAGDERVQFSRDDIADAAKELGIKLPKNLGDVIYSFRFRADFPKPLVSRAPTGKSWIIRLAGRGQYCFVANTLTAISPRTD